MDVFGSEYLVYKKKTLLRKARRTSSLLHKVNTLKTDEDCVSTSAQAHPIALRWHELSDRTIAFAYSALYV